MTIEREKDRSDEQVVKEVQIYVMSEPHKRSSYRLDQTLGKASLEAIRSTGQSPEDLAKWELATDAGAPLSFSDTFRQAGIKDEAVLRLTRKSGTAA